MIKANRLSKRRAELINKAANTPVSLPGKGRYSWESNLVSQVCEAGNIMEEMAKYLDEDAARMGFGGEYNRVCEILEKLNLYHEKRLAAIKTGKDWGDMGVQRNRTEKETVQNDGVFGKSWTEVESMQGGKLTI